MAVLSVFGQQQKRKVHHPIGLKDTHPSEDSFELKRKNGSPTPLQFKERNTSK